MTFSSSARATTTAVEPLFRNLKKGGAGFLPQRIAVIGQGATASTYATTKAQVFSANEVGSTYGYGSPLHLAVRELLPANGDGVGDIPVTVYPLEDGGGATVSAGDITPSISSQTASTFRVRVSGIYSLPFSVTATDTVATIVTKMTTAVNGVPEMPIIATDSTTTVDTASKWKGVSANDIVLAVDGPTDTGVTWAFTQHVSGTSNPVITGALAQIGPVWETLVVNCMEFDDTTTLDALQSENIGRWDPQVWTPFVAFTGVPEATYATAVAISDARPTDYTNSHISAQGSESLPCAIAARGAMRIAKQANENPAVGYNGKTLNTIYPGLDSQQWTYAQRDAGIKVGFSSSTKEDGVVKLGDIVTFYAPTGDTDPSYRYVVTLIKLWNFVYRINTIFRGDPWRSAPLIPSDQVSSNPLAKKPSDAIAEVAAVIDSAAKDAIISDPATAKKTIVAAINGSNPNRLDFSAQIQISGNTRIKAFDLSWGFYFGGN